VLDSESAFERERAGLERRVDRLLADNLMFRIETPYGAAGHEKPRGVASGTATVTTIRGAVTIRVWYV
jgi:hypothetical protein